MLVADVIPCGNGLLQSYNMGCGHVFNCSWAQQEIKTLFSSGHLQWGNVTELNGWEKKQRLALLMHCHSVGGEGWACWQSMFELIIKRTGCIERGRNEKLGCSTVWAFADSTEPKASQIPPPTPDYHQNVVIWTGMWLPCKKKAG